MNNIEDINKKLMLAAQSGNIETVQKLLLHKVDVNGIVKFEYSALMWAARNGHLDIITILLAYNANVNYVYIDGDTALLLAARNGHLDVVKMLLLCNADIEHMNNSGYTALLLAAQGGHVDVVNILLLYNADVNHQNDFGDTALAWAIENGHLKIKQTLNQFLIFIKWITIAAEKNIKKIVNILDNNVQELQEQLIINLLNDFLKQIKMWNDLDTIIIDMLKKEFINSLKLNSENYSLLHIAVFNNWQKLVNYLVIKWPVDVDYVDSSNNSAWNYACLLLQKENVVAIKSNKNLNNKDIKFLKTNIDLPKQKEYLIEVKEINQIAKNNRLNILKYYNINHEVENSNLASLKDEINAISEYQSTMNVNKEVSQSIKKL